MECPCLSLLVPALSLIVHALYLFVPACPWLSLLVPDLSLALTGIIGKYPFVVVMVVVVGLGNSSGWFG